MAINPYLIGQQGEHSFYRLLDLNLRSIECYIYRDLKLQIQSRSTQIDMIVLCKKGYFCIEIKNWSGIYTLDSSDSVYGKLIYENIERDILNPSIQNSRHCRMLTSVTGRHFGNIVAFSNKANFVNRLSEFYYFSEVPFYIMSLPDIYSSSQIREVKKLLDKLSENDILSRFI